jgi:hypothetical protein
MMKVSLVLLIAVLTFSAVVPVSAGTPKKLQDAMDAGVYRVNGWWWWDAYYDPVVHALVWEVSADEPFYMDHGWYTEDTAENVFNYPNHGWFMGHPHKVDFVIDSESIVEKRYSSGLIKYFFDGEEWIFHLWSFYYIFEPGDLAIGDHIFNIYYSSTNSYYDDTLGKWVKLDEPFSLDLLSFNYPVFHQYGGVLIIRVLP